MLIVPQPRPLFLSYSSAAVAPGRARDEIDAMPICPRRGKFWIASPNFVHYLIQKTDQLRAENSVLNKRIEEATDILMTCNIEKEGIQIDLKGHIIIMKPQVYEKMIAKEMLKLGTRKLKGKITNENRQHLKANQK